MSVYKTQFKKRGGYLLDMSRVTYNSHIVASFKYLLQLLTLNFFPISMYKSLLKKIKEKSS